MPFAGDQKLGFILTAKDLASAEIKKVNTEIAKMEKTTKGAKTGFSGLLSTVKPSTLAIGAAAGAATIFAGVLVDSTEKAIADEESQNRLRASLLTNVPAFNGNTDAIEKNITAAQSLGFSDEELRNSLTVLVGATHNVAKAQEIMSTAMDLARFKGIDLQTASEALIKVEGGQYRSLKQLGIKLKENATSQDALRAVQKVAAGQAKAYGDTTAGAMKEASIAVDELEEGFGRGLVPVVKDMAKVTTNVLVPALQGAEDALAGMAKETNGLSDDLIGAIATGFRPDKLIQFGTDLQNGVTRWANGSAAVITEWQGKTTDDLDSVSNAYDDVGSSITITAADTQIAADQMAQATDDMTKKILDDAKALIDGAFDPISAKNKLSADEAEIAAQRRIIASHKATGVEKSDAQDAIDSTMRDVAEQLLALSEAGQTGTTAYKRGVSQLREYAKTQTGQAKADIDAFIAKLRQAGQVGTQIFGASFRVTTTGKVTSGGGGGKARGGPASGWTLVGEEGPEIVNFPGSGTQVHSASSTAQALGGGGTVVNFNSIWPPTPAQARAIAEAVDEHLYNPLRRAVPSSGRV